MPERPSLQPGRTLIAASARTAALDVLTGTVIGQCLPRHRHTEFIKFLNAYPTPYVWTITAESILAKVQRTRTKLQHAVKQD